MIIPDIKIYNDYTGSDIKNRKYTQETNTAKINPVVRKHKNVSISDIKQVISGRTCTHKVLFYVSGQKT